MNPTTDPQIVHCPQCGAANRVPAERRDEDEGIRSGTVPAVEARAELERDPGTAAGHAAHEAAVQLRRLPGHEPHRRRDAGGRGHAVAAVDDVVAVVALQAVVAAQAAQRVVGGSEFRFAIGAVREADPEFIRALHLSFLTLGSLTLLSSLMFWRLRTNDGNNVSNRPATPEAAEAA